MDNVDRSVSYTDADIATWLLEHKGNISAVARQLNTRRKYIADRVERRPELKELLEEIRQTVIDKAEQNVFVSVESGDLGESRYVLGTIGKDRGYVARVETNKDPIIVNVRQFSDSNSAPEPSDG